MESGDTFKSAIATFCRIDASPEDRNAAGQSITAVVPSAVPLIDLVTDLKSFLTHEDGKVRRHATQLLVEVVENIPGNSMTAKQMRTFCTFFCERMVDYPSVGPCISGMKALLQEHGEGLPLEEVNHFVSTIFKELHVPAMEQKLRQQVFELFKVIVQDEKYLQVLNDDPVSVAAGFSDAMEAEKDPRCLVVCLEVMGAITRAFGASLQSLSEQIFDVVSCYFPITFNPPPNDPFGISKDMLVASLESAMLANEILIPHLAPFLLDKIHSTLAAAKTDSFDMIVKAADRFGINAILPWAGEFADAVRQEVVHGEDEAVIATALRCATSLTRFAMERSLGSVAFPRPVSSASAAEGTSRDGSALDAIVMFWMENGTREIEKSPESMVGRAFGRLLAAVAAAGSAAFALVVQTLGPTLLSRLSRVHDTTDAARGGPGAGVCSTLRTLTGILTALNPQINFPKGGHPLQPHVEPFLDAVCTVYLHAPSSVSDPRVDGSVAAPTTGDALPVPLEAYSSPSYNDETGIRVESKQLAGEALAALLSISSVPLTSHDNVLKAIRLLTDGMLNDRASLVRESAADQLALMSRRRAYLADLVREEALPSLLKSLKQHAHKEGEALHLVAKLASVPAIFVSTLPELLEAFNLQYKEETPTSMEEYINHGTAGLRELAAIAQQNATDANSMEQCLLGPPTDPTTSSTSGAAACALRYIFLAALQDLSVGSRGVVPQQQLSTVVDVAAFFQTITCHSSSIIQHGWKRAMAALLLRLSDGGSGALTEIDTAMEGKEEGDAASASIEQRSSAVIQQALGQAQSYFSSTRVDANTVPFVWRLAPLWASTLGCGAVDAKDHTTWVIPVAKTLVSVLLDQATAGTPTSAALNALAELLGSLLNRIAKGAGEAASQAVESMVSSIMEAVSHSNDDIGPIATVCLWATRGLAMANSQHAKPLLSYLLQLIVEGAPGPAQFVASNIGRLLSDGGLLSKAMGAHVSVLYKQKIYGAFFPALLQQASQPPSAVSEEEKTEGEVVHRIASTIALCSLAAHLPFSLVASQLEDLLRPVLITLRQRQPQGTLSALETFRLIATNKPTLIQQHIQVAIRALLALAKPPNSPIIRGVAIECLAHLAQLPFSKVQPYQEEVVDGLRIVLDDKSRAVRRRAAACRNAW